MGLTALPGMLRLAPPRQAPTGAQPVTPCRTLRLGHRHSHRGRPAALDPRANLAWRGT